MAFRFTEEDFKRYVKMDEHGGRHIWHELEDRLETEFGISFSSAPYIARGDRLSMLWLAPKATPRSNWANQAQFFLARSIEDKRLDFGLMVECPTHSDVAKYGYDPDRDGPRFVAHLESDATFRQEIERLVREQGFHLWVNVWNEGDQFAATPDEMLEILKSLPPDQGWGAHIARRMTMDEAITAGDAIADQIMDTYRAVRPFWESVIPDADRQFLEKIVNETGKVSIEPPPPPLVDLVARYFASQGFHFTSHQLATFYTALKTKGFVILSGLSGTGKTKLAQLFAELMPSPAVETVEEPEVSEVDIRVQVQPYMLKYARIIIPKGYWKLIDVPSAGETVEIEVSFDGRKQKCRFGHAAYSGTDYLGLYFREEVKKWFVSSFQEGDPVALEPIIDEEEGNFIGFRLSHPKTRRVRKREGNCRFVPVRPDWRDSKSLLGYFNPLTGSFESTEFLRFILTAIEEYQKQGEEAFPRFIILDEMNLARVEYYFADFLSVLESGRGSDGWTKEAIALHDFRTPVEDADGNLIPAQIKLPPNLYFAGTVNVDETTYMFSPKVLDRAFTIEFTEVDFADYPTQAGKELLEKELEGLRQQLLKDFIRNGKFAVVDKGTIAEFAARHPKYREHLDRLKVLLQPYDLHFAYRVFDEITAFLANAEDSPVFSGFTGLDDAFDTAVLMKVLPKLHGPRGKLEKPLQALLAWALQPDNHDEGWTKLKPRLDDETKKWTKWEESLETGGLEPFLAELNFAYPRTARKALRMLRSLYTTGFASFA
ncbi:MAG: McrB family protein [Anaerolineae bacterium]